MLLSLTLDGQILKSIPVDTGTQTLLAPSDNFTTISSNSTSTASSVAYRFVLNNAAADQTVTFTTAKVLGLAADTAIALYDASGNLVVLQDADMGGVNAAETLTTALQSGQKYTVEFFEMATNTFGGQATTERLDINPGTQATGDTLATNPATGSGSLSTSGAPDAFVASANVRYFPLALLNAGQTGSVAITPNGADTAVDASLFEQATTGGAWTQISTITLAAGATTATLTVTPPAGGDITDANYEIAIAPLNFTAAAEPVTLAVTSPPLLPGSVNISNAHLAIGESLSSAGIVSGTATGSFTAHAGLLGSVLAAVTGPMTVTYTPTTSYAPLLGIYGPGGSSLLNVTSSTTASAVVTATFNAVAGTTYYLQFAPDNSTTTSGSFSVTTSQTYTATPISVGSTVGTQASLPIANGNGAIPFQLTAPIGSNYLALQLSPNNSTLQTQISITGPNQAVQTTFASGLGQPVTVVIDESQLSGPYDVLLSGVGGSGTGATLKYVALTTPSTIAVNQFPTVYMNLATASVTSGSLPVTTGTATGVQYFQLPNSSPLALSTYTATSSSGATAVLLHYVQNGSVFQLAESKTPNNSGVASTDDVARSQTLHALVALPVNFSGTGTVQLTDSGPSPTGVGVAFVPNQPPSLNPTPPFQSTASVTGATLSSANQVDLYQAQVPYDLTSTTSSLVFTPVNLNGINATISVLNSSNVTLASATNTSGQAISVPVSGLTAGETLRFLVQPTAGTNIGNGTYGLSMTVTTTNPAPYLVTQQTFYPFTSSQTAGRSYFPNVTPTPITYSSTGTVTVTGNFTSSTPYNNNGTGSIQVYAISGFSSASTYQITTSDIDASVDTNFALFYGTGFSGNNPSSYIHVPGTGPSFDYYPADRSQIDARIVVNNTALDATTYGGEFPPPYVVYVVVMNEQGTLGHYSLSVAPVPVTNTGPGANASNAQDLTFAPNSGSVSNPDTLDSVSGNSYSVRTPADMASGATINLNAQTTSTTTGQLIQVSVGNGQVHLGTFSGTINSNHFTNISITGLAANTTYGFVISSTASPFPALDLTMTVPQTSGGPPAVVTTSSAVPQDGSYNSAIPRLEPQPTGALNSTFNLSGGAFQTVFNVQYESTITLKVAYPSGSAGVDVALYQLGQQVSGSSWISGKVLRDFTTTTTAGNYTLVDVVAPGTYVLSGSGTVPGGTQVATVTGSIPPVPAVALTVEPTTGNITAPEDSIINVGTASSPSNVDPSFQSYRYSTSFFELTVPSNTNGQPISVTLYDNDANADLTSVGVGVADVTIWRLSNGIYLPVGSQINALNDSGTNSANSTVTATDTPVAGAQYFIGVDLNAFASAVYVTAHVPVFVSGTPDYDVAPIQLLPNSGQTLVQDIISDNSYTSSPQTTYTLQLGNTTVTRTIPVLAPFGSYVVSVPWTPVAATDVAAIVVNPAGAVVELSSTNNSQSVALSSVDPSKPTAQIALADAAMTGEGSASPGVDTNGTWGRYIAGVKGQTATINFTGADPDGDFFQIDAVGPSVNGKATFSLTGFGTTDPTTLDFGSLTGGGNNSISYYAVDNYGLRSGTFLQTLDVITAPDYLSGGLPAPDVPGTGGAITYTAATHSFGLKFQDAIINDSLSLSTLLNLDVPIIGDTQNQFLVAINATGTGTFNPTPDVPLNFVGEVTVLAVGQKVFDKTFTPGTSGPNFTFSVQSLIDGQTLEPASGTIVMTGSKIDLGTIKSPLVPLFSFGIPKIVGVDVGIKYSIGGSLSFGAKLGEDQTTQSGSGFLDSLGLMSPTFIQPSLTATASVVGSVDVAGFDIASVTGSVGLTLSLTLGLDNNAPGAIIPVSDLASHVGTSVNISMNVGIAASVFLIGNVFTYNYTLASENIVNTIKQGIFLTDPPSFGSGKFLAPGSPSQPADGDTPADSPVGPDPIIFNGSSLVGSNPVNATPQIAINPSTGMGLSVQVTNAAAPGNPPLGNLAFATRANSSAAWSGLTTLSSSFDDSDPVLALSNDGTAGTTPAVVVYGADNVAGAPNNQTYNQRLASQDLRYRYFNGSTWGSEIALTNDNLYDSQQTTAFDASGDGVLAYVHNTDSAPMNSSGTFDSGANQIYASVWNHTTHTFSAPTAITTTTGVDNSQPATFVDSNGKRYIVWIQTSGTTSQLMYSTSTGSGAWSTPVTLPTSGLAAGGTFKRVAIGSDGAGRVNVLFAYSVNNADGTMTSTLYERPATTTGFTNTQPAVQIAQNADFSGLKTTNNSSGALIAYWEQSDGQSNQIVETTIANGIATAPIQVTDDPNVASSPSAAMDTNGHLQVLYDNSVLYGGTSQGSPTDPSVGAPMATGVASSSAANLPQLTFTNGLTFPFGSQNSATVGSQLTGTAVVANRGLASASVTVTAYDGVPGSGGTAIATSQPFTLLPGASYNFSQVFTVLAGSQTYSLQATSSSGEAFNTTENITTTTLSGLVDIGSTQLKTPSGTATAGQATTLTETFHNNSNTAIGAFTVTLYSGDPDAPQFPATVLGTANVTSLAANADGSVSFPITVPAGAGDDIYTALVDSNNVITESNESNNESRFEVLIQADPTVFDPGTGAVTATLLNSSNANNVQVVVNVENLGPVPLFNVPVDLLDSRNSGAFTSDGQITIPELDPNTPVAETFTVTALAGDNLFVGRIDNSEAAVDSNLSNNSGSADLNVPGLPTLSASISLGGSTSVPGAALKLTAHLSNTGLGDANNIPLVVLAALTSGGPSYVIGSATTSLSGLGSESLQLPLNTAGLAPGNYTITFEIDPQQTILQGSEAGNIVTASETLVAGAIGNFVLDATTQRLDYTYTGAVPGNVNAASLVLTNTTTSQTISPASFTITGGGNTASFTFPGFAHGLPKGNYLATLNGGSNFNFTVLPGDATKDGTVDSNDFDALAAHFGQTSGMKWSFGDFNYDGIVNALDFNALATNYGSVAASAPVADVVPEALSAAPTASDIFSSRPIADADADLASILSA